MRASPRASIARSLDRRGTYPTWVLLVALSGMFCTTFPVTVLTLALPSIADDFGTGVSSTTWVVTLPMITSTLALPVLGRAGDLYGHRRAFVWGFVAAVVFTVLSATASTLVLLVLWRTLAQVAGAATIPSSLALINAEYTGAARAKAMGWWSMVAAGAPVLGLSVGAPAIEALGWPTLFVLQAVLMVVPVVASWLVLRETPRRAVRFDVPGAVALTIAVGPLLLAVSQLPEWGLLDPWTLLCVAVAVVGAAGFRFVQQRSEAPLVPLSILRSRATGSVIVVALFSGASYMGGFFLASLLVVEQFDYSATGAVPVLSIRPLLFAVTSPVGGWCTARLGSRRTTIAGCLALIGGMAGIALGAAAESLPIVVVGFVLQGTAYGLLRPAVSTALADAVDTADLGVAGAVERLFGQLGVVFGIAILASIYGGDVDRFPLGFAVGAGFAVAATLGATAMARSGSGADEADREGEEPRDVATAPQPGDVIP